MRLLILGVLVLLATWISFHFSRAPGAVSTMWLASGLLAGVLLVSPRRAWRGYLLMAFAASLVARIAQGDAWFSILALSFAGVMEAGVVSFVLTSCVGDWSHPGSIKRVGWLAVASNFCACALSALLVATVLASLGTASFATVLGEWFASHTIGMAIFATLTGVALQRGRQLFGRPGYRMEFALTLALVAAVCLGVFSQSRPLFFLVYPPLMLCVFRHRFDGAVLGIAVVVVIAITATLSGHGPLHLGPGGGSTERMLLLQLFLAVTCLLVLPVAIVLTERSFLTRGLRESERRHRELAKTLEQRNVELESLNLKLGSAQTQLLQSAKMASVGQLAAGVAHEINNPIGYVRSNLTTLTDYVQRIFSVLQGYEQLEKFLPSAPPELIAVQAIKQRVELDYVREDVVNLLAESIEGVTRVERIVKDLKDFSRVDQAEWQQVNVHDCIDSTLNVISHELKYKADVVKEY
ncbi:MAG: MASE1 domain-containing protein, partial [Dokdonella sp.]